ncbi:4Fe-4S single cluster domain-containing protein [Austwickia chelonae]|uniref:Anaerobic ribonucleoside-triphosphate reductase-activating protein n=1 Tax=Austwickia chelonae NBRC 105200 TaxID=1184607 RepID=K6VPA7_9MICO|nr:4Fe-4S single cluster domain-containing protein [Austwickia chelonae]GAB78534.1 anaerobic ribonucleoside-triphosphate reductase activating protein [Austwickia chelonae NBRC 105200]
MRIAGRVQDSIVDGPGLRYVVFAQGCDLSCTGCQNPQSQPFEAGTVVSVDTLIAEMQDNPLTGGLTLSGGEPTRQAGPAARLASAAKERGLNVWCYSGYRVEHLLRRARTEPELGELLHLVDVLVDGPFVLARRSLSLPWRGSTNQRLVDLPATLVSGEIRLAG